MNRLECIVLYGSLMSGGSTSIHSRLKENLKYVGKCLIPGELYDLGRIPALKPGHFKVHGELYEIINPEILNILDKYEAIDNQDPLLPGFSRKKVTLLNPKQEAWVYYYDGEVNPNQLIKSGQWAPIPI